MKKLLIGSALASLGASTALAGGLDRSGQWITPLFEDGNYAEFSIGHVTPDVTGTAYGVDVEDSVNGDYNQIGLAYKGDFGDNISYAIIYDQPFGALTEYPTSNNANPLLGTNVSPLVSGVNAEVTSSAVTVLFQYNVNDNISIYGGPRVQRVKATYAIPTLGIVDKNGVPTGLPSTLQGYFLDADESTAFGYSVGAAYERKDIALRASLTYNSAIEHELDITETVPSNALSALPTEIVTEGLKVSTPQSLNFEFQTGLNERTLLFASARWVDWSEFSFNTPTHAALRNTPITSYDDDTITYGIGLGYKLTENFSLAGSLSYEAATGGVTNLLGPTDGRFGYGLAGVYTNGPIKITAGVSHIELGDSENTALRHAFKDNSALGFGVKVGVSF